MTLLATIVVITNIGYTAAFDTETRCPAWVQYDLDPSEVVCTNRASFAFHRHPSVRESDNGPDYSGSGFDRGHLAPAADFNYDASALHETYSFVNVCPMAPRLNRGHWREAEDAVRRMAASGTVRVVTFPVFNDGTNRIGRVRVPDRFVKVAYGPKGAFLWVMDNR